MKITNFINASMLKKAGMKIIQFGGAHGGVILTGIAVAGVVATAVYAVKGTKKYLEAEETRKEELGDDFSVEEGLTKGKAKRLWKAYWAMCVSLVLTIGAATGAQYVNSKKLAIAAAAASLAESKANDILAKFDKERADEREFKKEVHNGEIFNDINSSTIIETGHGKTLFKEYWTGQYFRASVDYIDSLVAQATVYLRDNDSVSFGDIFPFMNACGFTYNYGYIGNVDNGLCPIMETLNPGENDLMIDEPVVVIKFRNEPCNLAW